MFAYALIAAELLLFSLVFYLIFIKEPKQFEVKENLWGIYGSDEKKDPTYLKPFMTTVENKLAFPQQAENSVQKGGASTRSILNSSVWSSAPDMVLEDYQEEPNKNSRTAGFSSKKSNPEAA